jgi:hypothetical protein
MSKPEKIPRARWLEARKAQRYTSKPPRLLVSGGTLILPRRNVTLAEKLRLEHFSMVCNTNARTRKGPRSQYTYRKGTGYRKSRCLHGRGRAVGAGSYDEGAHLRHLERLNQGRSSMRNPAQ